jgi:hypothetical protein
MDKLFAGLEIPPAPEEDEDWYIWRI